MYDYNTSFAEFAKNWNAMGDLRLEHYREVSHAVMVGKSVNPEILADYPDLQKSYDWEVILGAIRKSQERYIQAQIDFKAKYSADDIVTAYHKQHGKRLYKGNSAYLLYLDAKGFFVGCFPDSHELNVYLMTPRNDQAVELDMTDPMNKPFMTYKKSVGNIEVIK